MKTAMFTFSGIAIAGDHIGLSARAPGGGQSNVTYVVKAGDALTDIVTALAQKINSGSSEWGDSSGAFRAVAKGDVLIVMLSDLVSNVGLYAQAQADAATRAAGGVAGEDISIEVLG